MARGLNLTSTDIREWSGLVRGQPGPKTSGDADLKFLIEVYDDAGGYVKSVSIEERFSDLPAQERAALNNFLRLKSKRFNKDLVQENTSTWTDL